MKSIKIDVNRRDLLVNVLGFGALVIFFLVLKNLDAVRNLFFWIVSLLIPFFIAFALYFVLLPLKTLIFRIFPKQLSLRLRNKSATFLTCILVVLLIFLFFFLFVPQLISSIEILVTQLPTYFQQVSAFLSNYISSEELLSSLTNLLNSAVPYIKTFLESIKDILLGVLGGSLPFLVNALITISFLMVLLSEHQQLRVEARKFLFFTLPKTIASNVLSTIGDISTIFRRYMIGQLTDALLVGVVTFIGMMILGLPYPLLIAFIIAITNMIPFFGPFIGAIPCGILILIVNPIQALIFLIMILVIQQIDGNIIAPMIVGDSLDIPPIYILFAITIGGSLFGILGMLIGVPVFSVIMMLFKRLVLFIEKQRLKTSE